MFGTIGRFRPKAGHEDAITDLLADWERTRRPSVPGLVVQLGGQPVDRPGEMLVVIAVQDEDTYRDLAASPDQDAWYRKMVEHLDAEPTWEDISWQTLQANVIGTNPTE